MNLCVDSKSVSYNYSANSLENLVDRLERAGYEPLVRKALESLCASLGGSVDDIFSLLAKDSRMRGVREIEHEASLRRLVDLERLGYSWQADGNQQVGPIHKVSGELFFTEDHSGILFLTVVEYAGKGAHANSPAVCKVRVGYLGDPDEKASFNRFADETTRAFEDIGVDLNGAFVRDEFQSNQFHRLAATDSDSNYYFAPAISEKDSKSARVLKERDVREIAGVVRKAGVILAKELLKQSVDNPAELIKFVDSLLQADLLRQEYVVICSKTGAHVLRVDNRDALERMTTLGILCSCGQPISGEPTEGLLTADPMLHRMLDGNYWLVATVVRQLHALGVPSERMLIHSSEEGKEVEFIVDLDGTLVMLEFTDGEFGINQAVVISPRTGIYQPKILFIAATRGVTADVKEHFARTRPDTEVICVSDIEQLEAGLKDMVDGIRMNRALTWIACFQSLLSFPLAPVLLSNLKGSVKSQSLQSVSSVQIHAEPSAPHFDADAAQIQAEFEQARKVADFEFELSDMRSPLSNATAAAQGQPSQPVQAVQAAQAVQPAQTVQPVQPVQPVQASPSNRLAQLAQSPESSVAQTAVSPSPAPSPAPAVDLTALSPVESQPVSVATTGDSLPQPAASAGETVATQASATATVQSEAAPQPKREPAAQPPAPWENLEALGATEEAQTDTTPALAEPATAAELAADLAQSAVPEAPVISAPPPQAQPSVIDAPAGTKAASLGLSAAQIGFGDDTDLDDDLDAPWGNLDVATTDSASSAASAAAQLIQQLEAPAAATAPAPAAPSHDGQMAGSAKNTASSPSEVLKNSWQTDSLSAPQGEAKADFQIVDAPAAAAETAPSPGWSSDTLAAKAQTDDEDNPVAPPAGSAAR